MTLPLDDFEAVCGACNGACLIEGFLPPRSRKPKPYIQCYACKGTGKVPSEYGLRLVAFLEKYFSGHDHGHLIS